MSRGTLDPARSISVSSTGFSPSSICLPMQFDYQFRMLNAVLTPSGLLLLVWPPPRSLATTCGISVDFFSSPYLDVSVRAVPLITLFIHVMMHTLHICGLLHSDTLGSKRVCRSPRLFAACRVLLRLLMPRHSPCALISLNTNLSELCLVLKDLFFRRS